MIKKTKKNFLCRKYAWEISFVYELYVYVIEMANFDYNRNIKLKYLKNERSFASQ